LVGESNESALEIKKDGLGILSWSTRGQLGIGSTIKAATGLQTNDLSPKELVEIFKSVLKSNKKYFEFTQKILRGAKDIFTNGGPVTPLYREQKFRML
jgi:hypothetical protein